MARVVRRALPYVGRVSGAFLVLSGAYLLAYWLPQLAGRRDGTALSRGGGTVAGSVTEWLQGRTSAVALLAAAVVAAVLVVAFLRRAHQPSADDDACCAPETSRAPAGDRAVD